MFNDDDTEFSMAGFSYDDDDYSEEMNDEGFDDDFEDDEYDDGFKDEFYEDENVEDDYTDEDSYDDREAEDGYDDNFDYDKFYNIKDDMIEEDSLPSPFLQVRYCMDI